MLGWSIFLGIVFSLVLICLPIFLFDETESTWEKIQMVVLSLALGVLFIVSFSIYNQEKSEEKLKEKYPEIVKIIDKIDYENRLQQLSDEKEKIEEEYQRLLNSKENNNEDK